MTDNKNFYEINTRSHGQFNNDDSVVSGSNYALKLAFQTMKERCQKLQKRLTCLEDENLQLRIERHSVPALIKKEPKSDVSILQKQVEEFKRQTSLLCHHIHMVSAENKDLWERLSKISEENELFDNNLHRLNENGKKLLKPEHSYHIVEACHSQGVKEDSLEEISLKILNSLKKKSTLGNEDEEDNMNWNDVAVRDCEFTLEMEEDEEVGLYEGLMVEVKRVLEKLKSEKLILKQQQEGLKSAIDIATKHFKEKQLCKNCVTLQEELDKERMSKALDSTVKSKGRDDEVLDSSSLREPNFNISKSKENAFEDRICPLCTKFYPKSTPFDEFNEHVLSHFVEEPEQDSLMSNYEILA